ncbi:hypothetical protein HYH02_003873 [Chlamydomonas schloesseri]|uniref:MYND-type domain-containing protein n=1 Tax=Chlamydomonas schloesseri TaxID=2026947 RepID=A0A836B8X7_9CHLO|nr:hypothetical protein HYH02_003873 [Chlamydomonas schloesseri]|eukprot:KAG2451266.1 hypothetical protein HYH02_003873 [Chlamydomonas schloesseri]
MAPKPSLTSANAVEFVSAAFDDLDAAESADRGQRLDEAVEKYARAISSINEFLAAPFAGNFSGFIEPSELRSMLPGVQLRLDRLRKMQQVRDAPPVPGAIPLTGPNAAVSLSTEDAHDVAARAAAAAAAKSCHRAPAAAPAAASSSKGPPGVPDAGAGPGGDAAALFGPGSAAGAGAADQQRETAQRLEQELLRVAGAAGAASQPGATSPAAAVTTAPAAKEAGSAASEATRAAATEQQQQQKQQGGPGAGGGASLQCAACGLPGRWGEAGGAVPAGPASLLRCGRCRAAFYCSKECQKQDWGKHKSDCC